MLTFTYGRGTRNVIAFALIILFAFALLHSRDGVKNDARVRSTYPKQNHFEVEQSLPTTTTPEGPNTHSTPGSSSYDDIEDAPVTIGLQETQLWNDAIVANGGRKEVYVPGFTMYERMYLLNGTFCIVTSDETKFPPKHLILSKPLDLGTTVDLTPTDQELRFIHPRDASQILGSHAMRLKGLTIVMYDSPQFQKHFYHWWGEIMLGLWRVYSSLWDAAKMGVQTSGAVKYPPAPARFMIPFSPAPSEQWRDRAGVNAPLMRAAFSSASIQESDYWKDLKDLRTTVIFDRVMIINREAAHKHPFGSKWFKMIAGAMSVTPTTPNFWEPLRQSILRNLLGYTWKLDESGVPSRSDTGALSQPQIEIPTKPVVTYISRQSTSRRLLNDDHVGLIQALQKLEDEGLCKVFVPQMEFMTLKEQMDVVSRTTIMVGVHGNGLTHSLMMPPTSRSTLIEIFYPPGYVFDYEMLARNMGHKHYGVWNDTLVTFPAGTYHEGVHYGDQFHGSFIPVYGPAVADLIRERLTASIQDLAV